MLKNVKHLKIVILILPLLAITIIAFSPVLKNAFNYDDDLYIKENRFIKSLSLYSVEKIFTSFFAAKLNKYINFKPKYKLDAILEKTIEYETQML